MTTAGLRKDSLTGQLRDCLAHLHDPPYLQRHPLARRVAQRALAEGGPGAGLHAWLVRAIERVRPTLGEGAGAGDRLWRPYHALRLRYVEAQDVGRVCALLAISQAEFYREVGKALEGLAALFEEDFGPEHTAVHSYAPQISPRLRPFQVNAPLVGRRDELEFLLAHLQAVQHTGQGALVLVTGDAGVGKTRLLRELEQLVRHGGARFACGRYLRDGLSPYQGWSDALHTLVRGLLARGLPSELLHYHAQLAELFPDLLSESEAPGGRREVSAEAGRLFECVVELLRLLSSPAPLVLVVEDIHWAGGLRLLSHVARRMHEFPVLIICSAREQEFQDSPTSVQQWAELERARLGVRLRLSPLNEDETEGILQHCFGASVATSLRSAVYERTRGNPFFVEEVARALVESGDVSWDGSAWRVTEIAAISIPPSVKLAIKERIDRLGEPYGEVLAWAAVLGQRFSLRVLAAVMDVSEESLLEIMERLLEARVLEDDTSVGEECLTFADEHVQEVLYSSIAGPRRRRYHQRALQVIERLFAHEADLHVEELARHAMEGNQTVQAAAYAYQAGLKADRLHAWDRAIAWYEQALGLWERAGGHTLEHAEACAKLGRTLYESTSNPSLGAEYLATALAEYEALGLTAKVAELHGELGRVHMLSGDLRMLDLHQALQHLTLSWEMLQKGGPSVESGLACFNLAQAHARLLRVSQAIDWAERSLEIAGQVGSVELDTKSRIVLGGLLSGAADPVRSREMLEQAWLSAVAHHLGEEADYCRYAGARSCVAIKAPLSGLQWVDRRPDFRTRWSLIDLQSHVVGIHALLGDFAASRAAYQTMTRRLEASGQARFGHFPSNPGLLLARSGEWEAAEQLLRAGLVWAQERQYILAAIYAAITLGELYLDWGRETEGVDQLTWAADVARTSGSVAATYRVVPRLAEFYVQQDDLGTAQRLLEQAPPGRFPWSTGVEADLLLARALVTASQSGAETGAAAYSESLARMQDARLLWDAARARFAWARLLATQGLHRQAQTEAEAAAASWRALGALRYAELAGRR